MNSKPEILVYRRTHTGDPDVTGIFGYNDCMGQVREFSYDAVIGIGGKKPWRGDEGIAERITWIGISPKRRSATAGDIARMKADNQNFSGFVAKQVTFDRFYLWNKGGQLLKDVSPRLHQYMFEEGKIPRHAKYFSEEIYSELLKILALTDGIPITQCDADSKVSCQLNEKLRNCK